MAALLKLPSWGGSVCPVRLTPSTESEENKMILPMQHNHRAGRIMGNGWGIL